MQSGFARHRRLGRLAHLYRIPKSVDKLCLNQITHAMSNLDHALVPRVIDLIEDERTYDLVTEVVPPEVWVPPGELYERLRVLEQIGSALCDAATLGLAHGALNAQSLRVERLPAELAHESQGSVKLVGLGVQQLSADGDVETLKARDLATLKEWIGACLSQGIANLSS